MRALLACGDARLKKAPPGLARLERTGPRAGPLDGIVPLPLPQGQFRARGVERQMARHGRIGTEGGQFCAGLAGLACHQQSATARFSLTTGVGVRPRRRS